MKFIPVCTTSKVLQSPHWGSFCCTVCGRFSRTIELQLMRKTLRPSYNEFVHQNILFIMQNVKNYISKTKRLRQNFWMCPVQKWLVGCKCMFVFTKSVHLTIKQSVGRRSQSQTVFVGVCMTMPKEFYKMKKEEEPFRHLRL